MGERGEDACRKVEGAEVRGGGLEGWRGGDRGTKERRAYMLHARCRGPAWAKTEVRSVRLWLRAGMWARVVLSAGKMYEVPQRVVFAVMMDQVNLSVGESATQWARRVDGEVRSVRVRL